MNRKLERPWGRALGLEGGGEGQRPTGACLVASERQPGVLQYSLHPSGTRAERPGLQG